MPIARIASQPQIFHRNALDTIFSGPVNNILEVSAVVKSSKVELERSIQACRTVMPVIEPNCTNRCPALSIGWLTPTNTPTNTICRNGMHYQDGLPKVLYALVCTLPKVMQFEWRQDDAEVTPEEFLGFPTDKRREAWNNLWESDLI
jgi:hypothetical protein